MNSMFWYKVVSAIERERVPWGQSRGYSVTESSCNVKQDCQGGSYCDLLACEPAMQVSGGQ